MRGETTSDVFEKASTDEVGCQYHGSPRPGMAMTVTLA
jgi:hypothetical protein